MAKSIYQVLVEIEGNEKAQAALMDIGKAAGLTGAALTAFSAAAAKSAASYETSLAKVATLATDATGTTQEFDAAINQLSQEMDGAISINEAAAASYDILSAGYSDQADVLAILRESQKTAIGGFSDLATISDASTTVMNAFGDALGTNISVTEKMKLVTDGMIATQNLGKITAGEYAAQIGNVASTAAAAGVSLQEVNAVIATATASGVRAEASFTGMNAILSALMKPSSEAAKLARELGIQFDAAALKSMGLQGVLKQLTDNGQATADNLSVLFGSVEALKVLMPVVADDSAKFNENLAAMADTAGTVDEAFATMSETTEQRVQNALNQLQNGLIKLGQGVLIAAEPVINVLTFLVDKFTSLPTPIQQTVGAVIAFSGAALTLAGGIAIVTASLATATTGIAAFTGGIAAAQAAVTSFAAYNGITAASLGMLVVQMGLVIAAIGAVALAYDSLREKGTEFKDNSARLRDGIREVTEELERQNNELAINDESQLKAIKARREWFDLLGGRQKQRIADIEVNAYDVAENANVAIDKIRTLGNTQAEQAAKQKLYQLGIKELDETLKELSQREVDLGTEKYEVLRANILASKNALEATAKAVGVTGEKAAASTGQIDGMAQATEKLAAAQAKANQEIAALQSGTASTTATIQAAPIPSPANIPVVDPATLERTAKASEESTKKLTEQITTAQQNLGTLQSVQSVTEQQLQVQSGLSDAAKSYLQSQVNELKNLNTTALNMHNSIKFISAQINSLPSAIANSLPRPQPVPTASR